MEANNWTSLSDLPKGPLRKLNPSEMEIMRELRADLPLEEQSKPPRPVEKKKRDSASPDPFLLLILAGAYILVNSNYATDILARIFPSFGFERTMMPASIVRFVLTLWIYHEAKKHLNF